MQSQIPNKPRSHRSQRKTNGSQFDISFQVNNEHFVNYAGEFAFKWAQETKGDKMALPTFNEIIKGLSSFFESHLDQSTGGHPQPRVEAIKK